METNGGGVPVTLGRKLHPRHGVHAPRSGLPARRPGTIRRTSTIDAHRPDGMLGDLVQSGRARDLRTHPDGTTEVIGEATVVARLDYANRYSLTSIDASPDPSALSQLIGASVSTGFRAAVADTLPEEVAGATLLHLLLDDLPGAALVSGYAIGAAGFHPEFKQRRTGEVLQIPGLCAGFQPGGTIVEAMQVDGLAPIVTGPLATSIVPPEDALAWHTLGELGPHDMRRWRCLDVTPGEIVTVEAYFRDSHLDAVGVETVIHEYTVHATVDPATSVVLTSSADAHTLPWTECIEARDSGDRLAGRPLLGLRPSVRAELTGITTCTHLNDTMRSIEDVRALLSLLDC